MKLNITRQQAENLKLDAKTLVDISSLLDMDGRFNAMPGILRGIASDLQEVMSDANVGKEVIDRARVQRYEPNA